MKRWNCNTNDYCVDPKMDTFIEEVIAVCKKHGYSISHEDSHGAFVIAPYTDAEANWLRDAHVERV